MKGILIMAAALLLTCSVQAEEFGAGGLIYDSPTLQIDEAPMDGDVFTVDEDGTFTVELEGRCIKPTMPPVEEVEFIYDYGGKIEVRSPEQLEHKTLVAAQYDLSETAEADGSQALGRFIGAKAYDITTAEIPATKLHGTYYSAEVDVSEFAYSYIRLMLFDSLDCMEPLADVGDAFVVWTGAAPDDRMIRLLKPHDKRKGIYTGLASRLISVDENDKFIESFTLPPGAYRIEINGYGDHYHADFTILSVEDYSEQPDCIHPPSDDIGK